MNVEDLRGLCQAKVRPRSRLPLSPAPVDVRRVADSVSVSDDDASVSPPRVWSEMNETGFLGGVLAVVPNLGLVYRDRTRVRIEPVT